MANSSIAKTKTSEPAQSASIMPVIAPAVGWLIPGAGHIIQKRWIRGALLLVSIGTLFVLGLMMQGHIYKANGGDILEDVRFIRHHGGRGTDDLTKAKKGDQGAITSAISDA